MSDRKRNAAVLPASMLKLQSRATGRHARKIPPRCLPAWAAVGIILLATVLLPGLALAEAALRHPWWLIRVQTAVAIIYASTSAMIIAEGLLALRPPTPPRTGIPEADALPSCTAVVAAYLPNEQDIIVETLLHILSEVEVPGDRLQVLLAYNTPYDLPVEDDLRGMAEADPRLTVLRVEESRSKAENVNAALKAARGEVIAIFDADHWPAADGFRRAWRSLGSGADMVQGRCVIRNHTQSWLTRLVAVEFDIMYACSHQGRARMSGSGIFGGSNAYWKREPLERVQLDAAMLTEDIDASVRALLLGHALVHDRDITSRELAPVKVAHWFTQRKRWSQGWFEVSIKHGAAVMRSAALSPRQKVLWWYLLCWREAFPILSLQFFSLMLAAAVLHHRIDWFAPGFFLGTSILNLSAGAAVVVLTWACCRKDVRQGRAPWYFVYALVGILYTTVKTMVMLMAQLSQLTKEHNWVATPRTAEGATAMVVAFDDTEGPNGEDEAVDAPSSAHAASDIETAKNSKISI